MGKNREEGGGEHAPPLIAGPVNPSGSVAPDYRGASSGKAPPRPGPCLDFGFQYALIRNNWSKKFGVEYWPFTVAVNLWYFQFFQKANEKRKKNILRALRKLQCMRKYILKTFKDLEEMF